MSGTDDDLIECWCGAKGCYEDLFSDDPFKGSGCGGSGSLTCECGGDQCVCHHHGEVECPGCDECKHEDDYMAVDDYYED